MGGTGESLLGWREWEGAPAGWGEREGAPAGWGEWGRASLGGGSGREPPLGGLGPASFLPAGHGTSNWNNPPCPSQRRHLLNAPLSQEVESSRDQNREEEINPT